MVEAVAEQEAQPVFRKYEFLAFSLLSFVGMSLLLVRLPYREAYINAIYTSGLLIWFYVYLRFRYGIKPPFSLLLFLGGAVAVDVLGNFYQMYGRSFGPVMYDEFSHFTAAALSLPPVMWLLREMTRKFGHRLPLMLVSFLSVTIAFSLTAYYEVLELWDERFYGGKRLWTPTDSANDLQWGLFGVVLAALITALVFKLMDVRRGELHRGGSRGRY